MAPRTLREIPAASVERASADPRHEELLALVAGNPDHQLVTERRLLRMLHVALARLGSITVVLESLWDPHNVSAVLRSAEGLGLLEAHVVEHPHRTRLNADVLRGADRWLTLGRYPDLRSCLERLRERSFLICAADIGEGCVPIDRLPVSAPVAVVLGSEKDGLTTRAKQLADVRFTIPMTGMTESFNVSVSAALTLWELTRRRRELLDEGRLGDLPVERAAELVTRWLGEARSVPK